MSLKNKLFLLIDSSVKFSLLFSVFDEFWFSIDWFVAVLSLLLIFLVSLFISINLFIVISSFLILISFDTNIFFFDKIAPNTPIKIKKDKVDEYITIWIFLHPSSLVSLFELEYEFEQLLFSFELKLLFISLKFELLLLLSF